MSRIQSDFKAITIIINYSIIEYFPFTLTLPKLYSDASFKMAPKFENYVPIQFKKYILYKYIYCDVLETHRD